MIDIRSKIKEKYGEDLFVEINPPLFGMYDSSYPPTSSRRLVETAHDLKKYWLDKLAGCFCYGAIISELEDIKKIIDEIYDLEKYFNIIMDFHIERQIQVFKNRLLLRHEKILENLEELSRYNSAKTEYKVEKSP